MKTIINYGVTLSIAFSFLACNKEKKYANQLDGEEYTITELKVDNDNVEEKPSLEFDNCKHNKELCSGTWEGHGHSTASEATFYWQFNEDASTFTISNQTDEQGNEAAQQCSQFSGTYNVDERKKDSFTLSSTTLSLLTGKKVVMKLEKGHYH